MMCLAFRRLVNQFAPYSWYIELLCLDCPIQVDPTKRERYLTDADFKEKFGMEFSEFFLLPAWKKTKAKKDTKLF